jgi:EAL domain-containing protein (putative c-di-GMP-specific phosphodiesterase class I)
MQKRRTLELALREALNGGQFELHYQPVVDIAKNTITSCEALIRWHHPERGNIPPTEFIPLAEDIGLIVPLGNWALHRACEDAVTWPSDAKVAVNLSPTQIASRGLIPSIMQALGAARLPPNRLVIEITEAVLMRNSEATIATLYQLRSLGIQIALDDFGTGFSSLSYLRSFPFDKLKIDKSFVAGLAHSDEDVSIVRAVTGLARSLHMTTTAEGVETERQVEQVRELGCTEMQGDFFSPALPMRDLLRVMTRDQKHRHVA